MIDDLGCAAYSLSIDVVLWPCCHRQQPPYAASVSTSSTQWCLHWFSAHLSAVLGLGTYADSLCTAVTRSPCQLPWSSNWWAGICRILHHQLKMYCNSDCNQCALLLLQWTQLHLNWCSIFQSLCLRPWFAKHAMQINKYLRCWPYRPTPTDFFLGAHTSNLTSDSSCILSFSVPLNYFWNC